MNIDALIDPQFCDGQQVKRILTAQSAVEWLKNNTSLNIEGEDDTENLSAGAKLFIIKYCELMDQRTGVVEENIAGMGQSFSQKSVNEILRAYAKELLGAECLCPQMKTSSKAQRWH